MDQQKIGVLVTIPEAMRDEGACVVLERRIAVVQEDGNVTPAVPGGIISQSCSEHQGSALTPTA
jgi:hypothetical protein